MKVSKKLVIIFISIIILTIIFVCNSYAGSIDDLGDLNAYKTTEASGSATLENKAKVILGVIRTVGIVSSVTMLMAIGIKYMLGSVEERAEYKKSLIPYIVGAFLIFTGSLVPEIIYQFMQNF